MFSLFQFIPYLVFGGDVFAELEFEKLNVGFGDYGVLYAGFYRDYVTGGYALAFAVKNYYSFAGYNVPDFVAAFM